MPQTSRQEPRVLYSFPHRIGAGQICHTAWQQVEGLQRAGARMIVATGSVAKPLAPGVTVMETMGRGRFRLPVRLLGRINACMLHDMVVARKLRSLAGCIDLVHTWPLGSLWTSQVAAEMGIPVVLERPNAHTRFAFRVVAEECERLGYHLPKGHEHKFNQITLKREEREYELADFLLCPSDFVADTFADAGFDRAKLLRHQYGYDGERFMPAPAAKPPGEGLTVIYAGVCAPRKGLHKALRAWLDSGASERGRFLVCGGFVQGYRELLADLLAHPSVEVLGHRSDLDVLMRQSDILVLPTIEEGSALVTYEAMASGCVLLVSDASGAPCTHMASGLVHKAGDVIGLTSHMALLDRDRALLESLKSATLEAAKSLTWVKAGEALLTAYRDAIQTYARQNA